VNVLSWPGLAIAVKHGQPVMFQALNDCGDSAYWILRSFLAKDA
jgi:hypothetical protein